MRKTLFWIISSLAVLALVLSACATTTPTTAPSEPDVEETEAPSDEEPSDEEPEAFDLAMMDALYTTFLEDMVAYNTIGLDALNLALAEEPPPFVLDVRNASEVEENGYIPGSVLIPLRDLATEESISLLPSFDTPIVSYCGSGWRCTIALTALELMGWEDVTGLKGGSFGGWVDAGYAISEGLPEATPLDVAEPDAALLAHVDSVMSAIPEGWGVITAENLSILILEDPDVVLLDVRRAEELDSNGWIENAIHIPLEDLIDRKAEWPATDASIVVYCGSGHRSTIAMTMLWTYGYTDVLSLKDGFGGWVNEGYPIVGGEAALDISFEIFLEDMEAYNTISLENFNAALLEDPLPFILDVRGVSELEEHGYIEGAAVIPVRDLATEESLALLPSLDTQILSYCGSGWRCTIALTALEGMGWDDVKCLKGGSFTGWVDAGYPSAAGVPEAVELDVAAPDTFLVAEIGEMLAAVPEGWGVVTAEALAQELIENPDIVLLDVRRLEEVEANGVIEGAIHIPLEEFIAGKAEWPAADSTVVVYCGSGHRSTIAMTILWAYDYADVRSLKDGFGGWVDAGFGTVPYTAP